MTNEQFSAIQNVPVIIDFTVDEGLGRDTTISVIAKQISNTEIKLTGPNNIMLSESAIRTKVKSLIVPGITEVLFLFIAVLKPQVKYNGSLYLSVRSPLLR